MCTREFTEWQLAVQLARRHAERIAAADWRMQGCPIPRRRGDQRFSVTATHRTLIEMQSDSTLTRERVLAFIHAPEAYTWDPEARNRTI